MFSGRLTNDAKDAKDVWGEDNKHVDEGEEDDSNGDMTEPVEGLIGKEHLLDGPAHLSITTKKCFHVL